MTDINLIIDKSETDAYGIQCLPVFPLPVFLLGGGRQRLRIFEPKYLSMIARATEQGGFVIGMFKKNNHFLVPDWGVHVKVVDFDMEKSGILIVDVLALRMVTLTGLYHQKDGLLMAQTKTMPHWSDIGAPQQQDQAIDNLLTRKTEYPTEIDSHHHKVLSRALKGLFDAHKEINELYKTQDFNYAEWVSARLLELVPLTLDEKEGFIRQLGFSQLNELLMTLFEKKRTKQ
ncbi:LON peptidase substrate-binding domain-containing protein [Vibrio amylolyticus]|uniref:LON peptidase substrate-binding domain-containing protein n=1 Tax=Vibrio amylolyticus TaxID=2847292 RepID=UPI0035502684